MPEGKTKFDRTIDVLTLLVITVGLIFAVDQAYEIRNSIDSAKKSIDATNANTNFQTWNSIAQEWLDLDGLFIEHPKQIGRAHV